MSKVDRAAELAFFLQDSLGSVLGTWIGHLSAATSYRLLGHDCGRETLVSINGDKETVTLYDKLNRTADKYSWSEI